VTRLALASDHAGYAVKEELATRLREVAREESHLDIGKAPAGDLSRGAEL
jgi:ribose 5-phosphate isomerase RpiB